VVESHWKSGNIVFQTGFLIFSTDLMQSLPSYFGDSFIVLTCALAMLRAGIVLPASVCVCVCLSVCLSAQNIENF